ncbi:hypothetical protein EDI_114510 [Entamoeba dispar SAW760]|uniref:Uncharacterized protein n=1 Tax=Entamoeba dispar (strain ATCC PRA-260 / SAW760) TaxID=370354 RepID=B0ELV8_ENTDS|nr:uncharacterized protein EDI_114510 [Entamoeba dispar SAW760]EDR24501.1 hypothetical protein EDI_114510 [Entamoeba dispar SAW760]|eukprot:EDR24501.1 hypothetical protein EDI_114510 [Entamoeba dispar SAW760]
MNILYITLLILFANSKSLLGIETKDVNGNPVAFVHVDFNKCYYQSENKYVQYTNENNIIYFKSYSDMNCSNVIDEQTYGINDDKLKHLICNGFEIKCSVKITEPPKYIGSMTFGGEDDKECSHSDDMIKYYITNIPFKSSENAEGYCQYKETNGEMYLDIYPNIKCIESEKISHIKEWTCDTCTKNIKYECKEIDSNSDSKENSSLSDDSSMSYSETISILTIIFILTFFF